MWYWLLICCSVFYSIQGLICFTIAIKSALSALKSDVLYSQSEASLVQDREDTLFICGGIHAALSVGFLAQALRLL